MVRTPIVANLAVRLALRPSFDFVTLRLAVPWQRARINELCAIEAEARASKRGMWAGEFELPYHREGGPKPREKVTCAEWRQVGPSAMRHRLSIKASEGRTRRARL